MYLFVFFPFLYLLMFSSYVIDLFIFSLNKWKAKSVGTAGREYILTRLFEMERLYPKSGQHFQVKIQMKGRGKKETLQFHTTLQSKTTFARLPRPYITSQSAPLANPDQYSSLTQLCWLRFILTVFFISMRLSSSLTSDFYCLVWCLYLADFSCMYL